jgi:catechol 2,3-dioxygenase-like lactoylglutathione lyase family enzyme
MTKIKFDHCVIHVSNWGASHAFYRDILGAEVIRQGENWAYRFGSVQLNCHGPGTEANPVAKRPGKAGDSDLCFEWPGKIEDAMAHLEKHGVAIELGPVNRRAVRGRGRSIYFRDPDGSLLELISYPEQGAFQAQHRA